jgi:hypothetical protein
MMVGGPEGGTAGMRFNPRESAEELQGDSTVGREDSDERARDDAKKREEQEKRAHKLQGLQHMKVKIPQKDPDDEEDSQVKQQAELSQLTGQVGQSEANAGANPRASGMGMNMMLSTAPFIDDAFEMIRKKKDAPKFDTDKPQKTTTIETIRARERAKTGKKRKARKNVTTESIKRRRRKKGKGTPTKAGNIRAPGFASTYAAARAPYASFGGGYTYRQRTAPIRVGGATGRSRAKQAYADPRQREAEAMRQQQRQSQPTQDLTPPIPTVTPKARIPKAIRGSRDSRPHGKAMRQPRTAKTPGGKIMSEATSLAGGAGGIGASDAILASEEFLKARAQRVKITNRISPRDKIEYRQLIDQLNHLLRRMMRKEDKSMQGASEGASDNASGGLTSAPTGATETDPDDDATRWGAHPYDLYVRRGGL